MMPTTNNNNVSGSHNVYEHYRTLEDSSRIDSDTDDNETDRRGKYHASLVLQHSKAAEAATATTTTIPLFVVSNKCHTKWMMWICHRFQSYLCMFLLFLVCSKLYSSSSLSSYTRCSFMFRGAYHHPMESTLLPSFANEESEMVLFIDTKRQTIVEDIISITQQQQQQQQREMIILEALKHLDEEIKGDVILQSNKTKFKKANHMWQQSANMKTTTSLSSSSSSLPLAIIEAVTTKDVELSLLILTGLARDYQLKFRIRSGGHSYMNEYSNVPDGVILSVAKLNAIDTSNIYGTEASRSATASYTLQTRNKNNYTKDINSTAEGEFGSRETSTTISSTTTRRTANRMVTIQPGVTVESFMQIVLDGYGCSGIVASAAGVSMGGFILGGGYGLQSRMYGLAIDNVMSMNVVLTNGETKHDVSLTKNDDLFWALRGAGNGNFGVVTSFDYRVYPSSDIKLEGTVKVPLAELTLFLQKLGEIEDQLLPQFNLRVYGYEAVPSSEMEKESLVLSSQFRNADQHGLVKVLLFWMGDADPEQQQTGLQYIKNTIVPLFPNNITRDSFTFFYFSWSGMSRQREQVDTWKAVYSAQSWNGFLLPTNNTPTVWDDIQQSMSVVLRYTQYASPKIELWGGQISKMPSNASAFPHRNALYNIAIELLLPVGSDNQTGKDEANLIHAIWPSIGRHLDGVYINNAMASLSKSEYPMAYWGNNVNRLKQLKQQYDPYHVLTYEQSIPIN